MIINFRKSLSKAEPSASRNCFSCASVAIPGMAEWSWADSRFAPPLCVSQPSMAPISGFWLAVMRSASLLTEGEPERDGASRVNSSAWAWCRIIIRA